MENRPRLISLRKHFFPSAVAGHLLGLASASHGIPGLGCWGAGGGLGASLCVRAALGCLPGSGRRGACVRRVQMEPAAPFALGLWFAAVCGSGVQVGKGPGPPRGGRARQVGPRVPGCAWCSSSHVLGPPWDPSVHSRRPRPSVEATWGGPMACAASAPHRGPGHALSPAWVCQAARAGCAGQRKEHSSRVPCADRPRRRRQLPAPPRCPPRRVILAGVARCWRRWSVMWLWPGPSWSLGSSPGSSTGRWAAQCLGHGSMHQGACGVPPHP